MATTTTIKRRNPTASLPPCPDLPSPHLQGSSSPQNQQSSSAFSAEPSLPPPLPSSVSGAPLAHSTPNADTAALELSNGLDLHPWLLLLIIFVSGVFLLWLFFATPTGLFQHQQAGKGPEAPAPTRVTVVPAKACTSSPFNTDAWRLRYAEHPAIERLIASIAQFRRRPLAVAILAESGEVAATVARDIANAAYPTSSSCFCNITWAPDSKTLEQQTAAQLADVAANSLLMFGVGNRAWTSEQTHFIKLAVDSPHVFVSPTTSKYASSSRAFFLFYGQVPAPLTSVRELTSLWSDVGRPDIPTLLCFTIFAEKSEDPGLITLTLVPD